LKLYQIHISDFYTLLGSPLIVIEDTQKTTF